MTKIFYFDVETTGLDPDKNGIHQISAAIEIDGVIIREFDLKCRPFPGCLVDPAALAVSKVSEADIMLYPEESLAYDEMCAFLGLHCDKFNKTDKFHLCGFNNATFDDRFLRAMWDRAGDVYFGSWFWAGSLDVMILASYHLRDRRPLMPNFRLHTVAREFGIQVDDSKLHDARYDLMLTRHIYNKCSLTVGHTLQFKKLIREAADHIYLSEDKKEAVFHELKKIFERIKTDHSI